MPRVVIPGVAHHVTQRGIDRREVFFDDRDYETYLKLVQAGARHYGTDLLGYCIMPNHVHWVVSPHEPNSLACTFRDAHSRYSCYVNAKLGRNGHLWQNRFFSCSLDHSHLWTAMRYVERNPVRALMVDHAGAYRWSSAAVHIGKAARPDWLTVEPFQSTFTPEEWTILLESETLGQADVALRINTYNGRPVGSEEFVKLAEARVGRKLVAQAGGRPRLTDSASA